MLELTQAQLNVLTDVGERAFCTAILSDLRKAHPDRVIVWERGDLEQAAFAALKRAQLLALTSERDIRAFIVLDLMIAENWDSFPPLKKLLTESALPPAARMEHILTSVAPEEWDDVVAWHDKLRDA